MDKRRSNIITDLQDDRLFPDEVQEEGEALDFSLTLTQASSLFIICQSAIPTLKAQLDTLKKKLKTSTQEDMPDITDTIFVLEQVLQDAELIKDEATEIINEFN